METKSMRCSYRMHWTLAPVSEASACYVFQRSKYGTSNPNGERVYISHGSDIPKRQLLGHFRKARDVFSKIQSDRSEENVENVWSVSLHVEKDIDQRRQTTVGTTKINI
ncbi:hypothetical protein GQ457_07G044450 [Hibiscus cannabinus]